MEDIDTNRWQKRHVSRRSLFRASVFWGAGIWVSSVSGCGTSQSPRADSTPAGSSTVAKPKTVDLVTIAIPEEPPSFDAHKANGGVYTYFTTNVYEGLVSFDLQGKIAPQLATSWTMTPDGKTYEFKLRQGVKWHNGDPFTAKDVEFSWQRIKDPKVQPSQANYASWDTIEVVDDYTVRCHLKKTDPSFLGLASYLYYFLILPKKYYEQVGDAGFEKAPVGTGPYKFVRRAIKESWELAAFDGHWGNPPAVKRAIFKIVPESTTLAAVLKTGEADFVAMYPPLAVEDIQKAPGMRVVKNRASNTIDVRINTLKETDPTTGKPSPYRDKRVRMAMNLAVDRDAIINNILKGMGEKLAVLFPEDVGYDPNLKPYPYDPKKAKDLLAEAGYPSGFDAVYYGLLGERIPMSQEVGEALANYFTAVGIRTKVINEEYAAWKTRSSVSPSPDNLYPMGYGMTYVGGQFHPIKGFGSYVSCTGSTSWFCNKDLEALIDQMYVDTDPAKVELLVKKSAQILYDEAPVVMLYRNVMAYAMKDTLDFTPKPGSQYVELVNLRPKA